MKTCKQCNTGFEVTDEDRAFYDKVGPVYNGKKFAIPEPTLCPECRHQRRLVWRNERFLFRRVCDMCKKNLISMYPPENTFPIYCPDCFWGDQWNPLDYGREFDFNRPFFEQYKELLNSVPQLSIFQTNSTNSEYTLNSINNKNCYLTSGADYNEDCLYGINTQRSNDCVDHYLLYDSELCYGCLDSSRLYNCVGCQDCENCSDSWFLFDCKDCKNCAFSANLRSKEYVIFSEQCSEEEYEKKLQRALVSLFENPNWMKESMKKVQNHAIYRANLIINSENCVGDYIRNCKNSQYVFDVENVEDCKYVIHGLDMKDGFDISSGGWDSALAYDSVSILGYEVLFSSACLNNKNIVYCRSLWNSKSCFGCTSLHSQNQFCILNKQYSKEEYESFVAKLIAHMQKTGEWGEFFQPSLSPFEFNRSMPIDYTPVSKEEALRIGFRWHDEDKKAVQPATYKLPNVIEDVPDSAVDEILVCENCSRNYRIVTQELKFHRKMKLPLPKLCWPCRLQNLIKSRRPARLLENSCKKCQVDIKTTYSPERPEKVYCEQCYLKEVY